jgi:hypothetical protein
MAHLSLCTFLAEYGCAAWNPCEKELISKLEILLNKAQFYFWCQG